MPDWWLLVKQTDGSAYASRIVAWSFTADECGKPNRGDFITCGTPMVAEDSGAVWGATPIGDSAVVYAATRDEARELLQDLIKRGHVDDGVWIEPPQKAQPE